MDIVSLMKWLWNGEKERTEGSYTSLKYRFPVEEKGF